MEPKVTPATEIEAEEDNVAEPFPKWDEAFQVWGNAWELHVYSFGAIFLVLSLIALYSMTFYLKSCKRLKRGKTTFSLQCLLFIFSSLRGLSLVINPYLTSHTQDTITFAFIWAAALPGLTASFSLLLLVLLDTTKMTLGPPRFQNLYVILGITAGHFVIVMIADVLCFWTDTCKPMLMFCQALFIFYGLVLFIGYLYSAITIYRSCKAGDRSGEEYAKIQKISRIAFAASLTAFSICVTYIYSASSDFGIYSDVIYVEAWDWWILQSVIRLEEIVSCCLVLIVVVRNPLQSHCAKFASANRRVRSQPSMKTAITDVNQSGLNKSTHISSETIVQAF